MTPPLSPQEQILWNINQAEDDLRIASGILADGLKVADVAEARALVERSLGFIDAWLANPQGAF